jgi:cation:H+ antiporter
VAVPLLAFSIGAIYNPVAGMALGGMMTRPIALLPLLLYGLYLFLQQQDTAEYVAEEPDRDIAAGRQWLVLLAGLAVILLGVEGLVQAAIGLGDYFGTPSFLWGLTVIAAGTSLPDAFVSIKASQRGEGTVSMANVLGSNIFDLLVAVPVGILIAGATPVDYAVAAPMMGFLTLATIILFAMMRTQLTLSRTECAVLMLLYAVFVGWMVLETSGITSVVT